MKIGKTVKWMFLFTICNLSAQNKYSIDFAVNTQSSENITVNEVNFGLDYSKTFDSKFKIANKLVLNSKKINYFNDDISNSFIAFTEARNKFTISYLKIEKMYFNLEIEPFVASENNLKWNDIDWLGGLNMDFNWSPKTKIKLGISRNKFLESQ